MFTSMPTYSGCDESAWPPPRRRAASRPLGDVLSCLLLLVSVVFGEQMTYNVNKMACRDDALVLACATGEVVATTLYGGHHADVNATRCSNVPGDCQAPIKGFRISHWAKCLWKKSKCTFRLPLGGVFLYWPCGRHATIHYLIAEDFKCVSKNEVYTVNGSGDTVIHSLTGYVMSADYPQRYTGDGRRQWVTIAARVDSGVLLRTVDMAVRPAAFGVCRDYVEVTCSTSGSTWRHCGNTTWSVPREQCRGDVNVTFVTTHHTYSYKGFVIFFKHFLLPTTNSPGQVAKGPVPVLSNAWNVLPWTGLVAATVVIDCIAYMCASVSRTRGIQL